MDQLSLLKLISDLIKEDKPTTEQIKCARTIVDNLIVHYQPKLADAIGNVYIPSNLDPDAEQARQELLG